MSTPHEIHDPTVESLCLFSQLLEATDALIHVMNDEVQALIHCDTAAALALLEAKTEAITQHEHCVQEFIAENIQNTLTAEEIDVLQDQAQCLKHYLIVSENMLIAFQKADEQIVESVISHVKKTETPVCTYTKSGTPHANETPISAALCNRSL